MEELVKGTLTISQQELYRDMSSSIQRCISIATSTCLGMYSHDAAKYWEPIFCKHIRQEFIGYLKKIWGRYAIEVGNGEQLADGNILKLVLYVASPMPEIIPYNRTENFPAMEITLTLSRTGTEWVCTGRITKRVLVPKSVWESFVWGFITTERGVDKRDVRKIAGGTVDIKALYKEVTYYEQ